MSYIRTVGETPDYLVLEKPAGVHSVDIPGKDSETPSVVQFLAHNFPELKEASDKEGEYGMLQRLDFDSSGLLLVAKTLASFKLLRSKMDEGEIIKKYLIIVDGIVDFNEIEVEVFLYSRYRRSKKVSVSDEELKRSSLASTIFRKLKINKQLNCSLLQAELTSGFRHQIRASIAHIGFPLVGDKTYDSKRSLDEFKKKDFKGRSFYLHASELCVVDTEFFSTVTGPKI